MRDHLLPPDLRGTLAHEVMARTLRRGTPDVPARRWIEARAAQLLAPELDAEACQATARWAEQLAEVFLESPLAARALAARTRQPERPLLAPVRLPSGEQVLLRGTLDLLFLPPGSEEWVLVDYKTGPLRSLSEGEADPELASARLEEDAVQLQLYALLLESAGVRVGEAWVAYLEPGLAEEVPLDGLRSSALLQEHLEARREQHLPARPGRACQTCPWVDACDAALVAVESEAH